MTETAERLLALCRARDLRVATAESCTGGLIAACLTEIAGSSDVVDRGFVTYANEAKRDLLGVPGELLLRVGAVSEEVARAMAAGALDPLRRRPRGRGHRHRGPRRRHARQAGGARASCLRRAGRRALSTGGPSIRADRGAIRLATVETALAMLIDGAERRRT